MAVYRYRQPAAVPFTHQPHCKHSTKQVHCTLSLTALTAHIYLTAHTATSSSLHIPAVSTSNLLTTTPVRPVSSLGRTHGVAVRKQDAEESIG